MPAQPRESYNDLDLNFTPHINTKKLTPLRGQRAVTRALRNLLQTEHHEKPFHPEIGSRVNSLLFDNMDPHLAKSLEREIEVTIQNFEPRVVLNKVQVTALEEQNGVYINIFYFIRREPKEQVSNIFLERNR